MKQRNEGTERGKQKGKGGQKQEGEQEKIKGQMEIVGGQILKEGEWEGRYCQGSHATEVKGQQLLTFLMWLEVPLQKRVKIEEKQLQKKTKKTKLKYKIRTFMNSC